MVSGITINSLNNKLILENENKVRELASKRNTDELQNIMNQLDIKSENEEIVYENIKRLEKVIKGTIINRILVVDSKGYVKFSASKLGIEKIDISSGEGTDLSVRGTMFIAKNIVKLNENSYVVHFTENYIKDDMLSIKVAIVVGTIIFLILINSRVKYISYITKNVKTIATGDLSNRIDLKYKDELRDLAQDINYMAEELQKQDINQKEFITNISHDLRTPLTTILGYSKMIERKVYKDEEELNRYVSIINQKGNYLKTMMEDFFDYSRLSSRDLELEKNLINLNEVVLQLLDGEEINFKNKDLSLKVLLERKAIYTYGDPMLVARAFNNLISNSLKYSKENSQVKIQLKEKNINGVNYGVFTVENIPKQPMKEEVVENLFKRLYKIDKARNDKGSGLGLAITQEIVELHNGFVEATLCDENIRFSIGLIQHN